MQASPKWTNTWTKEALNTVFIFQPPIDDDTYILLKINLQSFSEHCIWTLICLLIINAPLDIVHKIVVDFRVAVREGILACIKLHMLPTRMSWITTIMMVIVLRNVVINLLQRGLFIKQISSSATESACKKRLCTSATKNMHKKERRARSIQIWCTWEFDDP